jgi:hypothetical protein
VPVLTTAVSSRLGIGPETLVLARLPFSRRQNPTEINHSGHLPTSLAGYLDSFLIAYIDSDTMENRTTIKPIMIDAKKLFKTKSILNLTSSATII